MSALPGKNFTRDMFIGKGMAGGTGGFIFPRSVMETYIWAWILSDGAPQPPRVRGLWTNDGVWLADAIWYS